MIKENLWKLILINNQISQIMDEISKLLTIIGEQSINNQAILRVILKEIAILKADTNKSSKTPNQIFDDLITDVNSERNIIESNLGI